MKMCVFSDIHGNQYALEKFVKLVKGKYDKYVFLGDICGYYYGADICVRLLSELSPLITVLGNHDKNYLDSEDDISRRNELIKKYGTSYSKRSADVKFWCESVDMCHVETIDGLKIAFVHGTLDNLLEGREYPDSKIQDSDKYSKYDVVFQGHTHYSMVHNHKGTVVINPGTIGQPRNKEGSTYLIFDTITNSYSFHKLEWKKDNLISDIKKNDPNRNDLIEVLQRENLL